MESTAEWEQGGAVMELLEQKHSETPGIGGLWAQLMFTEGLHGPKLSAVPHSRS